MIFATNATTVTFTYTCAGNYWPWYGELVVEVIVGVKTLPRLRTRAIEVDALDPGQRKARRGARRHKYRQVARLSERR